MKRSFEFLNKQLHSEAGRQIIKRLLLAMLALPIAGMLIILMVLGYYQTTLPDIETIKQYDPKIASRIYSSDGILIGEYAEHKRVYTPYDKIPRHLIDAFVAAEDENFWHHGGVDFGRIVIASITNVIRWLQGDRVHGASTITQQVARNLYLSRELSFERKFKEIALAMRLENALSKEQIMEFYLNEIYLGGRSYGIAHAASNYFGKTMDDLEVHESALLAGMPKAPSYYDPRRYPERAKNRRDIVLRQMYQNDLISEAVMRASQSLPLGVRDKNERPAGQPDSNYFVEEARLQLVDVLSEERLYTEGLTIYSTLDTRLQNIAERALRAGLVNYDQRNGWRGAIAQLRNLDDWHAHLNQFPSPRGLYDWSVAVVLETNSEQAKIGLRDGCLGLINRSDITWARRPLRPEEEEVIINKKYDLPILKDLRYALKKGDVIAVERVPDEAQESEESHPRDCREFPSFYVLRQIPEVEGAIVVLNVHTGRVLAMSGGYSWDRSLFNRATQAYRQPGSSFKPIVYLTALANGFTPTTEVIDAPLVLDQGTDSDLWRPENYSDKFYGPTLLRRGLEGSRNLITIRLAHAIGMDSVINYASRLGVLPIDTERDLTIAIGSKETTLLKLTNAYAMFANGGLGIRPAFIERIQNKDGKNIYRRDSRDCEFCRGRYRPSLRPPYPEDTRARVIDAPLAYQMVSMLEGVIERGTARWARIENMALAGKTGTTNDHKDVWFVGFSSDIAVGVFVGYDNPRSLGQLASGARVAAPIFRQFMTDAFGDKPAGLFRVPEGIRLVRINRFTGMAVQTEQDEKFAIFEAVRIQDEEDKGTAIVGRGAAYGYDRLHGRDKEKKLLGLY